MNKNVFVPISAGMSILGVVMLMAIVRLNEFLG